MLERTRKLHTKQVDLKFRGPASEKHRAVKLMASLGFEDTSDAVPWREVFPEYTDNSPGTALAGARYKEGLTQRRLSDLTGIPQRHISEMETGKRPIGRKCARSLSEVLKIDYRVLM
jgi:hypothetical protein